MVNVAVRSELDHQGILSRTYFKTTAATFSLIVIVAFEALALVTVMPSIAEELDGVNYYSLAFAAPLAGGIVGMVLAGIWTDRVGPTVPLIAALVVHAGGLTLCGTASSMETLVAGRLIQGLGGGASTVVLYVVVGSIYPTRLQPSIFASFSAAWVLPSLFGPYLAVLISDAFSWRWIFHGAVLLIAVVLVVLIPTLRSIPRRTEGTQAIPTSRLWWAVAAGISALGVKLLDSSIWLVGACLVVVLVSLASILPKGTLRLRRGLPAVIATRGLVSAGFFCADAYLVFVLTERWGLATSVAGLALTGVGVAWAIASQVQARLPNVTNTRALVIATTSMLCGISSLTVVVWVEAPASLAVMAYVLAGAGMGFGFPRLGVATMEASSDRDRGANSAALAAADSLSAALALSLTGVVFTRADAIGVDPFVAVYVLASVCAAGGLVAAGRTAPKASPHR